MTVQWTKMRVREFDKRYTRKSWMDVILNGATPASTIYVLLSRFDAIIAVKRGDAFRVQ